jgi:hypothetical protein
MGTGKRGEKGGGGEAVGDMREKHDRGTRKETVGK